MRFGLKTEKGQLWVEVAPVYEGQQLVGADVDVDMVGALHPLRPLHVSQWCNECSTIINKEFDMDEPESTYYALWEAVRQVVM